MTDVFRSSGMDSFSRDYGLSRAAIIGDSSGKKRAKALGDNITHSA